MHLKSILTGLKHSTSEQCNYYKLPALITWGYILMGINL